MAETLEELSFTMHLWMMPRFLSLLGTLERLKKLCIKIYLQYRDAEFTFPLASKPSNIQSLTLKVSDARVEQQKVSHQEKLKYLHPLAVSLPSHMSNVAELSLETYDVPLAFAATFLGRMAPASNLTIACNSRESDFDASTFKQQLSVEKVIFDAPSSMLDMIQSQLLTDLHVSVNTNSQASCFLLVDNPQYFSKLSSSLMQKLFLTNEWPNLQFLHLEASLCNWTNVSHPSLTCLRLRATHNDKRDYITHFCQQLALNPLNFPSLRELELDWYPQWDILFLMLERRNFQYEDSTFSNIEVLVLPSLTSPSILEPIRLLVQGKITERPSNYEASVTSLYSVISDEKRLGCLACLYARQPCTQIRELPQPGMDEQAPSEVREYVYPTTHDDILQDWDRRDQEAMDIIRGSRMQGKCNKVAHDTSITIS
ncbi:hypothetical protein FRC17_002562 [Serendipita sp. 399]|nr:hypothetical protein FRC17_002562 [Serendipita sp. 399]